MAITKRVYDRDLDAYYNLTYEPGEVYSPRFDVWLEPFSVGTGNGGGGAGTAFAEAYGPTADRPTDVGPGYQYFDTDEKQLVVWDGAAWAEFTPGPHTAVVPGDRPVFIQTDTPAHDGPYFWVKLIPGGGAEFYYEDGL